MSWHDTAAWLLGRPDTGPAAVYELLEHAAVGLLHQPAGQDSSAQLVRIYVHQAVGELTDAGVTAPAPTDVGIDTVHTGDVRPLLAAAATQLPRCLHDRDSMTQLAYARATVYARQARDALPDG
jgi:hypothetical protein